MMRSLWAAKRYGAFVWAGAFSVLAGCTHLGEAERQALQQASQQYARNETSTAIARLDRLIHDFGDAVEIAEAYYVRGLCRTKRGETAAAQADFSRAIAKSRRDDLTALCQASLAAIAYRQGSWSEAADRYGKAVEDLPVAPPTDEVLYYAGVAMQRAGRWDQAAEQFARIVKEFRQRPIAADARRLAAWRDYAIQLGAFRDAKKAAQLQRSWGGKRLDALRVESRPRGSYAMWLVLSGRYNTYAQASARLGRAQAVESGAFIVPRP